MKKMKVAEIALSRSGDKADISNVLVVPYREEDYELLKAQLTVERMKKAYGGLVKGSITRYEVPGAKVLNFVMTQALDGGIAKSLDLDIHGKSRGAIALEIEIDVPDDFQPLPKPMITY